MSKLCSNDPDEFLTEIRTLIHRFFIFLAGCHSGLMIVYSIYLFINLDNSLIIGSDSLKLDQMIYCMTTLTLLFGGEQMFFFYVKMGNASENGSLVQIRQTKKKLCKCVAFFVIYVLIYLVELVNHRFVGWLSANYQNSDLTQNFGIFSKVYAYMQLVIAILSFVVWVVISFTQVSPEQTNQVEQDRK